MRAIAIAAERELRRYAGDHALWHKHVHNVDLDAAQILKCLEMDRHPHTIDFSCRRTGKTSIKELYLLAQMALEPDQELGIVAPREQQSITNLSYHLEAIRRSPILSAWIRRKSGREQLADTYYQFENRSLARPYGIMSQVDGGDLTVASLEEVDDMPPERLYSRFLLMLGATRRLGASAKAKNQAAIRITGVFKGADTLQEMLDSGKFHALPVVDVALGLEMGLLQQSFIDLMRDQLSPEEYMRQMMCRNVAARNLIWEKWLRWAVQTGIQARVQIVEPMPGEIYRKRGLISLGYDASGHGEQPESSRHAVVVIEQIGNFFVPVYARQWPAGMDEATVKNDLIALWRYFSPDAAIGDAYGVAMITQLCDELYAGGLTPTDRRLIGDGQSTPTNWPHWPMAPLRFEGLAKHQMARALAALFVNRQVALPYVEDASAQRSASCEDMRLLQRQLPNIRAAATSKSYASYRMVDRKLGDDLFDAAMAAVWGLVDRMQVAPATAVLVGRGARDASLEYENA